jgi:hypothetical protein
LNPRARAASPSESPSRPSLRPPAAAAGRRYEFETNTNTDDLIIPLRAMDSKTGSVRLSCRATAAGAAGPPGPRPAAACPLQPEGPGLSKSKHSFFEMELQPDMDQQELLIEVSHLRAQKKVCSADCMFWRVGLILENYRHRRQRIGPSNWRKKIRC